MIWKYCFTLKQAGIDPSRVPGGTVLYALSFPSNLSAREAFFLNGGRTASLSSQVYPMPHIHTTSGRTWSGGDTARGRKVSYSARGEYAGSSEGMYAFFSRCWVPFCHAGQALFSAENQPGFFPLFCDCFWFCQEQIVPQSGVRTIALSDLNAFVNIQWSSGTRIGEGQLSFVEIASYLQKCL